MKLTDNDVVVAVALAWLTKDSKSIDAIHETAAICERLDLDPDQIAESGEVIEVLIALKATIKAPQKMGSLFVYTDSSGNSVPVTLGDWVDDSRYSTAEALSGAEVVAARRRLCEAKRWAHVCKKAERYHRRLRRRDDLRFVKSMHNYHPLTRSFLK